MILCGDILCLLMKESVTKSSDRLRLACWLEQRHTSSARFNFYPTAQHHFFLVSFPSPKRSDGVCVGLIGDGGVGGEGFVDKGERERKRQLHPWGRDKKRKICIWGREKKKCIRGGGGGGGGMCTWARERKKRKMCTWRKEEKNMYMREREKSFKCVSEVNSLWRFDLYDVYHLYEYILIKFVYFFLYLLFLNKCHLWMSVELR